MILGDRYVFTPGDLHRAQLINEEIARISRVIVHPKFRGIGLGEFLVRETLPKVKAKVVEALAVMAKYNPFFERAGMVKVECKRDQTPTEKKIKAFLETHGFDPALAGSGTYCHGFFARLSSQDKQALSGYLTEFAGQPFIDVETITPALLAKALSSESVYLYWIAVPPRKE